MRSKTVKRNRHIRKRTRSVKKGAGCTSSRCIQAKNPDDPLNNTNMNRAIANANKKNREVSSIFGITQKPSAINEELAAELNALNTSKLEANTADEEIIAQLEAEYKELEKAEKLDAEIKEMLASFVNNSTQRGGNRSKKVHLLIHIIDKQERNIIHIKKQLDKIKRLINHTSTSNNNRSLLMNKFIEGQTVLHKLMNNLEKYKSMSSNLSYHPKLY